MSCLNNLSRSKRFIFYFCPALSIGQTGEILQRSSEQVWTAATAAAWSLTTSSGLMGSRWVNSAVRVAIHSWGRCGSQRLLTFSPFHYSPPPFRPAEPADLLGWLKAPHPFQCWCAGWWATHGHHWRKQACPPTGTYCVWGNLGRKDQKFSTNTDLLWGKTITSTSGVALV